MRRPARRAPGRSSACRGCSGRIPTQLVHAFASALDAARDADVVVLCGDASSDELED
jgi:hypothetical protein